jgi:hypothetical protein
VGNHEVTADSLRTKRHEAYADPCQIVLFSSGLA